jgi:hypothetical protein
LPFSNSPENSNIKDVKTLDISRVLKSFSLIALTQKLGMRAEMGIASLISRFFFKISEFFYERAANR